MPRKKITTKTNEHIFFKTLTNKNPEPELWPLNMEGELAVDVYETQKEIIVKTAIAGIKPEDLHLSLDGDLLTIRGSRHEETKHEDRSYLCKECHWGAFSRSVILPAPIKSDKIKAQLQRGVLIVTLPKTKRDTKISVINLDE